MYEGARVLCFAPSGALLADWATPVQCPTMPCIATEDGNLYVTSARQGRPEAEIGRLPLSGQVLVRLAGVQGLPVNWCEVGNLG